MKKNIFVFVILFTTMISCTNKIKVSGHYQNPDSVLIPLLISPDMFNNQWSIEKIFYSQGDHPQNTSNSPLESATYTIWAYNEILEGNVLITHRLYRYNFPLKGIEDFPNRSDYFYIETDSNGVDLYQYCDGNRGSGNVFCGFAIIPDDSKVVASLDLIFPNIDTKRDIYEYGMSISEQIIESIKVNLLSIN